MSRKWNLIMEEGEKQGGEEGDQSRQRVEYVQ